MTPAEVTARLALFQSTPTSTTGGTRYVSTGSARRPLKGHPLP
ncbi:MAG: hypothetical protein ACRER3_07905 [Pseudomonas fluorescens]